MAFKLRSGNKTSFKMMGSSPVKSNGETYNERVTKENKRLKEVYEQQMKSYSDSTASYENRIKAYDLLKGKKFNVKNAQKALDAFNKLKQENKERGVYFDFRIAHIKPPGQKLSWFNQNKEKLLYVGEHSEPTGIYDDLTKEHIAEKLKPKNKPVKPKYHKTFVEVPSIKTITPSLIKQTPPVMPPKAEVPPEVLKKWEPVKNMDLWRKTTRNPANQKKGGNKRWYWKLPKLKGKKTRNLVTGGTNRTFRSTGTSRRKNRFMAKLTFWNRKD